MKRGKYITTVTIGDRKVDDVIDELQVLSDRTAGDAVLVLESEDDEWDYATGRFSVMAYTQEELDHNSAVLQLRLDAEKLGYEIRKREECASVPLPGDMSSISTLDNLSGLQLSGGEDDPQG